MILVKILSKERKETRKIYEKIFNYCLFPNRETVNEYKDEDGFYYVCFNQLSDYELEQLYEFNKVNVIENKIEV